MSSSRSRGWGPVAQTSAHQPDALAHRLRGPCTTSLDVANRTLSFLCGEESIALNHAECLGAIADRGADSPRAFDQSLTVGLTRPEVRMATFAALFRGLGADFRLCKTAAFSVDGSCLGTFVWERTWME